MKTKQLTDRVMCAQNNVKSLVADIKLWSLSPLFKRKDEMKCNLLAIEDRAERKEKRYGQITSTSATVAAIIQENYRLFFNIPEPEPIPQVMHKIEYWSAGYVISLFVLARRRCRRRTRSRTRRNGR